MGGSGPTGLAQELVILPPPPCLAILHAGYQKPPPQNKNTTDRNVPTSVDYKTERKGGYHTCCGAAGAVQGGEPSGAADVHIPGTGSPPPLGRDSPRLLCRGSPRPLVGHQQLACQWELQEAAHVRHDMGWQLQAPLCQLLVVCSLRSMYRRLNGMGVVAVKFKTSRAALHTSLLLLPLAAHCLCRLPAGKREGCV